VVVIEHHGASFDFRRLIVYIVKRVAPHPFLGEAYQDVLRVSSGVGLLVSWSNH